MQSKKLTRAQRIFVENNNLSTYDWNFVRDVDSSKMKIVNKVTNEIRTIDKLTKKKKKENR